MGKMIAKLVASAAAVAIVLGSGCGPKSPCDGVQCPAGQSCNSSSGTCTAIVPDAGAASRDAGAPDARAPLHADAGPGEPDAAAAGPDAGPGCNPPCSGSTPVCDLATSGCVVCTKSEGCATPYPVCDTSAAGGSGECEVCTRLLGCSGAAPFCDTTVQHGACEQCLQDDNCTPWICDPSSHKCVVPPPDAGPPLPPDAAWTEPLDAGPGTDDGGGALGPDGGVHCINRGDAGAVACTSSCADGFHCEAGQCVLNGGSGPVQVTLRWDQPEDLDLHVVEPLPSGGSCEIWYDDSNNPKGTSSCGARGSLDLDSNAGCSIDDVDIENVIYPQGSAPLGTYTVRVDYYANCFATSPVPFEVTVRANGVTNTYCGSFLPSDADSGGSGAGVLVTTFHVP